jgi:hypothetical protein
VEVIVQTVSQAKLIATYKYVRGHQDKKTAYNLLPFLAQLNVDADKYAGQYQQAYGSHRPIIPLSPTRPIALDLNGRTIHWNMKSEIQDAAHATPLLTRMTKQNKWMPRRYQPNPLGCPSAGYVRSTPPLKDTLCKALPWVSTSGEDCALQQSQLP